MVWLKNQHPHDAKIRLLALRENKSIHTRKMNKRKLIFDEGSIQNII